MSEKDFYASDKELTSTFETQNILIMESLQLYDINNNIDTSQFNNKLFVSQMNEKYMNSFFHILIVYYETPLFDYYDTAFLHIHENFFHKIENFHYNIASDNSDIKHNTENDKLMIKLKEQEIDLFEEHPLVGEIDNFCDVLLKDKENNVDFNLVDINDNVDENKKDNIKGEVSNIIKFN